MNYEKEYIKMKNFQTNDHPNFSVVYDVKLANKLLEKRFNIHHVDKNYKVIGTVFYFPWSEEVEEVIQEYYKLVQQIKNI